MHLFYMLGIIKNLYLFSSYVKIKQLINYLAQGQFLQFVGVQNVLSQSNMIWEDDGTLGTFPLFLLLYFWLFQALLKHYLVVCPI